MLMYISSADFMTRNMERRVEVATPIRDEKLKARIMNLLDLEFSDNVKAKRLLSNGEYSPVKNSKPPIDSQIDLFKLAYLRAEESARMRASRPVQPVTRPAQPQAAAPAARRRGLWEKIRALLRG